MVKRLIRAIVRWAQEEEPAPTPQSDDSQSVLYRPSDKLHARRDAAEWEYQSQIGGY